MNGMFIGGHKNRIDTKGRVSIPADFRRELERADPEWIEGKPTRMAIIYGDVRRNYVEVLSMKAMAKTLRQILAKKQGTRMRADLERIYFHGAHYANVDDTGRIVLPGRARETIGHCDQVLVLGSGDRIQIWNPVTYDTEGNINLIEDEDYDPNLDPAAYLDGDTYED